MDKQEAIRLLGGTIGAAATAIGVTPQAVYGWPDPLPQRIADRVQAALWRMSQQQGGEASLEADSATTETAADPEVKAA